MASKNVILNIVSIFSLLIIISCNSLKSDQIVSKKYKVVSIDTISDVYVFHAINNKKYFKIVSHKSNEIIPNCRLIKINKSYDLVLKSLFLNREKLPLMVESVEYYGQTISIEKDSIYDIYTSENIIGTCVLGK